MPKCWALQVIGVGQGRDKKASREWSISASSVPIPDCASNIRAVTSVVDNKKGQNSSFEILMKPPSFFLKSQILFICLFICVRAHTRGGQKTG